MNFAADRGCSCIGLRLKQLRFKHLIWNADPLQASILPVRFKLLNGQRALTRGHSICTIQSTSVASACRKSICRGVQLSSLEEQALSAWRPCCTEAPQAVRFYRPAGHALHTSPHLPLEVASWMACRPWPAGFDLSVCLNLGKAVL
jgi:hypothetical protein